MGRKSAELDKEYKRQYMKERRETFKKLHLCTSCGKQDERTLAGHIRCEACEAKRKPQTEEQRAQKNKRKRERNQRRIAEGLCTECGKPALNGMHTCTECIIKSRKWQEEKRREQGVVPKWLWEEMGLCVLCGAQRAEKQTAFGGRPVLLCERCYNNAVDGLAKGREIYLAKYGITWGDYQVKLASDLNQIRKAERKESDGRVTP